MLLCRSALLLILCGSVVLWGQDKKPPDRQSVPDAARQKEAEKAVRDPFRAEYAQKTASERKAFAQTLLRMIARFKRREGNVSDG
jgi:hypothetical protein